MQAEAAKQLQDISPRDSEKDHPVVEVPFIGPMRDPRNTEDANSQGNTARKDPVRIGRYHCIYERVHGHLSLDTDGVRFEILVTKKDKWSLKYSNLKSVQKVKRIVSTQQVVGSVQISTGEGILFIDMQDKQYRLSALERRDEVFTQIIGYSGIDWRVTG